ncbi:MAG: hypothetical protein V4638_08900 [Bacteroidota bacterium]
MKGIQYHIKAIGLSANFLLQGKFLLYFIPGLVIAGLYFYLNTDISALGSVAENAEEISWFKSVYYWGMEKTVGVLQFVSEQIYVFFVLTLLSPFNTFLSEKVDSEVTGITFGSSVFQIISDLVRMIYIVIIAILLELIFLFFYWIVSWILGLGEIDQVMYFLIASFFYGFTFYDYSLERYHKNTLSSLGFAFSNLFTVTITGAIFQAIYLIPYLGIPISPVIATMIATLVYIYNQQIPLKNDRTEAKLS